MRKWVQEKKKEMAHLAEVSSIGEIGRRYFIMNAFDGALTMLGVVIGAVVSGTEEPEIIIAAGISGSIAMGISGFSGAYLTEKAEREREMNKLRRAMLSGMDDSIHERAGRFASIITSIIDGVSPALAASIVVLPFVFAMLGLVAIGTAFMLSIIMTLITLFGLGAYLARVSKTSWITFGVRMLLVGTTVAIITFLVSKLFGSSSIL